MSLPTTPHGATGATGTGGTGTNTTASTSSTATATPASLITVAEATQCLLPLHTTEKATTEEAATTQGNQTSIQPTDGPGAPGAKTTDKKTSRSKHSRKTTGWAALLMRALGEVQYEARSLDLDALKCPVPGCGGRMVVLAFLTDPKAVSRVL